MTDVREVPSSVITVKMEDCETEALIDSGAGASLCSTDFKERISSVVSHPQFNPGQNIVLLDYTGTRRTRIEGEVTIPIRIREIEVYCSFLVVKGLNRNLLIGRDVMTRLNLELDFKNATANLEANGRSV